MFKNIFLKTLHEKRWMILGWSIAVILMSILMMTFYDSFNEGGFDLLAENTPDAWKSFIGDIQNQKTIPGFVSQQVYDLRIPLLTIIMSIMLFGGLLAGDEGDGTLQSLLVQPVSRIKVFVQKYLSALVITFLVSLSSIFGVIIGLVIIGESISLLRLVQASIGAGILAATFGSIAYAIGAYTGKRGLSGSIAGIYAFTCFLLTSFVQSVSSIETVEKISPFHYYNNPGIAQFGLDWSDNLILIVFSIVIIVFSAVKFNKRDIA